MAILSAGFFIAASISILIIRLDAERHERSRRRIRRAYGGDSPIWFRNTFTVSPLFAPGMVLLALAVVLPKSLALWPVFPGTELIALSFLLSYRVPAPFTPGWLRNEIAQGMTLVARPDHTDWLLFWVALPLIVVGTVALPILILGIHLE